MQFPRPLHLQAIKCTPWRAEIFETINFITNTFCPVRFKPSHGMHIFRLNWALSLHTQFHNYSLPSSLFYFTCFGFFLFLSHFPTDKECEKKTSEQQKWFQSIQMEWAINTQNVRQTEWNFGRAFGLKAKEIWEKNLRFGWETNEETIENYSTMYIRVVFITFFVVVVAFIDVNVMLDKFSTDNCYGKKLLKFKYFEGTLWQQKNTALLQVILLCFFFFFGLPRSLPYFILVRTQSKWISDPYQYVTVN